MADVLYLCLHSPAVAFRPFDHPKPFSVLGDTSQAVILRTLVFGFLCGFAVVLYGLRIDMLGLSLGTTIILGLGTSIGTLVPLIGKHREQLWAPSGIATLQASFS